MYKVRDSAMETDWISHRHNFQLSVTQGLLLHGKEEFLESIHLPQHLESTTADSTAPEVHTVCGDMAEHVMHIAGSYHSTCVALTHHRSSAGGRLPVGVSGEMA